MNRILFFPFILLSGVLTAQDFSIKRVELAGPAINIYYDLVDSVMTRTYTISLFSSKDNFITPMQKVSGDLGLEVRPGQNKKITWYAKDELGAEFVGKVSVEIRGRVYLPFIKLDQMTKAMKRLKSYELTWTGGTQQNILNFELFQGDEKVTNFPNIANVGHYTLNLPRDTKAGHHYYFKITDSKNKDQVVISPQFSVKRKMPLVAKGMLIGALGIGAVVGILEATKTPVTPSIPEAPGRPNE
jgi:hypothetical protein